MRIFYISLDFAITSLNIGSSWNNFRQLLRECLITSTVYGIPAVSLYCYLATYWIIPRFLPEKRYVSLTFSLLLALSVIAFLSCLALFHHYNHGWHYKYGFYIGIRGILEYSLTMGIPASFIIFFSIKTFKTWFQKQQEKQALIKANAEAEIQLLKAQVHPHFLFNTLNNIYACTLNDPKRSEELVLQLSNMMKYMIMDCDVPLVLLEKELKVISDYASLEKVRYGNHLNMQIEIKGNYKDKLIAPLLMIPFIENAFKHGASKMLEDPWIKLKINIENDQLLFSIVNNTSDAIGYSKGKNGIGLKNVEKRLTILYPKEHFLKITSAAGSFSVEMRVPLKTNGAVSTQRDQEKFQLQEPVVF